jgi:hypothetical protein
MIRAVPQPARTTEPASATRIAAAVICAVLAAVAAAGGGALLASPPFVTLNFLFLRYKYEEITGRLSTSPLFSGSGDAIVFAALAAIVAISVLYATRIPRAFPRRRTTLRAAVVFALMLVATHVLNRDVQAGLGIPAALLYALLITGVWWAAQHVAWGRRLVEAVVWAGTGFLVASGVVLPFVSGPARFDLQRLHGIYGYLWLPPLGAYLVEHLTHYEGRRSLSSRAGYAAAAVLAAAVLTGVARLHGGGETWASGFWPHVISGAIAVVAIAFHVGRIWSQRGMREPLGPGQRTATFVLGCVAAGTGIAAMVWAWGMRAPLPSTTEEAFADISRLETPGVGVTARGPDRAGLPVSVIGVRDAAVGCGRNGGCHVDVQAQWERSAHRFSANAAYRENVRLMIEEVGVESARLCAGCHDPVALLTGRIGAGVAYPDENSEGVTCVICHSMEPDHEAKNGRYTVQPSALFGASVKDPFTAYMMVELYRAEHREDHLAESLRDNSMCAACHNLTQGHLVLRRTFDEWAEGPHGPGKGDTKTCTACHMPSAGRSYVRPFELHDHRMAGSNVALAALRGETGELEREFIAAALDLEIAGEGSALELRLFNRRGAHGFPTAPHDLLDYWFEYRYEGPGVETQWRRLGDGSLFAESLKAHDGRMLERHEIWRATAKEGGEAIAPGAAHDYTFVLSPPPRATETLVVRLMHRRYQPAFLAFLGSRKQDLYTDPIEILRRARAWS